MKKKILFIVESFGGGVFTIIKDLINNINDDYEIVVAYSLRKQTPMNFKEQFNENIKFIQLKNFTRNINFIKDFKSLMEIRKIVKNENPDIVHLHSSKAGIIGRLGINGKRVKMFYNPHGFAFLKKDDSKLKRKIYWLIEKITAIYNKKCTIIACGMGEYKEAKKLNKNAICINNGIDIDGLDKITKKHKEKEIDYNNIKICTIGRIGYQKNPDLFNKIAKKFPNINFTWIGDGELNTTLTSENIKITGWKDRIEVLDAVSDNDVFILTSLWEGLPVSLLEAMYMKKICIVSDCIGNRDVIASGVNGFIAKDEKEFEECITNIMEKNVDVNRIESTAKEDCMEKYNLKIMVSKYKDAYEN